MAAGQVAPEAIAVDSENVYWLNAGSFHLLRNVILSDMNTSVMKCARQGCNGKPTALAANRSTGDVWPSGFAVGGGFVYWNDGSVPSGPSLVRCSSAGCGGQPEVVWSEVVGALAADASHVYAALSAGVVACPSPDCKGNALTLWSVPDTLEVTDMAVDASGVYWTTTATNQVLECSASGCNDTPTVVVTSGDGMSLTQRLALDVDNVYIANTNTCTLGSISRCPKSGCPGGATPFVTGLSSPTGLASDGQYLYFTDDGSGCSASANPDPDSVSSPSLRRCSVAGCNDHAETVASGFMGPSALALDDEYVFVADRTTGAIWRIPK
jgi:hypothetical protein